MARTSLWANSRVYLLTCSIYWGIFLFGYDSGVAGGVISTPAFQEAFGLVGARKSHIDNISSNVVSVLQGGGFFGAVASAFLSNRLGRRKALLIYVAVFTIGAVLQTIARAGATGLNLIYGGRFVSGMGIGGISAVCQAYVSECSPKDVRGRLTGLFQIWISAGLLVSYFTNYGVSLHIHSGPRVWRIPFAVQFIPAGIMGIGLLFCHESPRFLARAGRTEAALKTLAWYRRTSVDDFDTRMEMAEIEATIIEEREAREGLGWKEAFLGPGNWIRFVIAFIVFLLQQFCGQNSISYYAPSIFASIGYTGTTPALFASGVYGIVKVVSTCIFIFFFIEKWGRKWPLFWGALAMGMFFYILAAVLKTHPPVGHASGNAAPASRAMAALIYLYLSSYSFSWGPLPWIYPSEIFPNRTRHYGLAVAAGTSWLFNFANSKITPFMVTALGYKMFITFATINVFGMATFAFFIPETKGKSLEEMDIMFGAVSKVEREAGIKKAERVLVQDAGLRPLPRDSDMDEKDRADLEGGRELVDEKRSE